MKNFNFIINRICANTPPVGFKHASRILTILLVQLTFGVGQMWGLSKSFTTTTSGGFTNNSKTDAPITVTFSNGSSGNLNWQSGHLRFLASCGLQISCSSGYNITAVTINANSGYTNASLSGFSANQGKTQYTWSGTSTSISASNTGTAQARLTSIVVTYEATAPAATASITLNNYEGSTSTTGYHVGDSFTLPSTNSYTCGTKTFVGWSTSAVSSVAKPSSNYHEPGTSVTLAASNTFYAVFADKNDSKTEEDITITASDFGLSNSYATKTCSKGGFSFKVDKGYLNNSNIQMNTNNSGSPGKLYNTTSITGLKSITVNVGSGSNSKTVYSSTTSGGTTNQLGVVTDEDETFEVEEGDTYFTIQVSGANYISSVVVTYEEDVTTYSNYSTTCCSPLGSINGSFNEATQTTGVLRWKQLSDKVDSWAVTYRVKNSGDAFAAVSTSATTAEVIETVTYNKYTITGLQAGKTYEFKITPTLKSGICTPLESDLIVEGSTQAAYTITAGSNNTDYGTVSLTGTTITATLADYCRYATPAYTVVSGTATVAQGTGENVNKFTVTPSANCSIRINFEPIPVTGVTIKESTVEVSALSLEVGGSTTLTAAVAPNTANPGVNWTVTQADDFISFNTSTGAVSALKAGTATITATSTLDNTKTASCTVTVVPVVEYKKVTANLDDWSGEYLLVYDNSESEAWVWTGVDAGQCYATATISNSKITKPANGVKLTVEALTGDNEGKYSLKVVGGTNNGKYVGRNTTGNGLNIVADVLANTISYSTTEGNVGVVINSGQSTTMRFNSATGDNNLRFRYYGSGQQPVQLYRKVVTSAVTITDPAEGTGSLALANGQTPVASGDNIEAGTELTVTATPNGDNHYIGGTIVVKKTSDESVVTNLVLDGTTLTMPEYAITVSATFTPTYAVTQSGTGGTIAWEANTESGNLPKYFAAGTEVMITANADDTHTFTSLSLSDNVENPDIDENVAMFTMPASAVTATVVFAEKEDPSITVKNNVTSLTFGPVADNVSCDAQTFTISGANLEEGKLTVASNSNKFVISSTALDENGQMDVNGALGETVITVTPVTNVAGVFNGKVTISGGGLENAVEITLSLTVQQTYTAKWYVNGAEQTASTVTVVAGTALTFPANPSATGDCEGLVFQGWKVGAIDGTAASAPSYVNTGSATMPVNGVNYYAVFAEESSSDETESVTWSARYDEQTDVEGEKLAIGASAKVTFNKGTNSNKCQYYTNGYAIRVYGGGNFVVSAPSTMTSITLTFGTGDNNNAITANVGTYSDGSWEGEANSVTFSIGGTSNHRRIAGISVTYSASSLAGWVTTCPHCNKVTLQKVIAGEGAEAAGNAIAFSTASTTVKTCEAAEVTVSPTIATGWELKSVVPTGVTGVTYNAGVISIPAEATGELTVTATFSQIMVTEVELDETSLDVDMGASPVELHATCTPAEALDKTVTWTTSDGNVATVSNGTVTFVGAGTATITATCNGHNATCSVTVNPAPDVVLDFTNNTGWSFPLQAQKGTTEQSFTKGGYTVKVAGGNGYYFDETNQNLLVGKEGAYLELPSFNKPIDKIVCTGVSGGSSNVTRVVLRGEEVVSEAELTGCTTDQTFILEPQEQAESYVYTIKVTNGNNARFAKIKIYLGEVASVMRPTIAGAVNFVESAEVTLNCATEGATIYYTINGESPKAEGKIEYSAPFNVTENTIVKAAAYKEGDWSAISTKTFTKGTLYTVAQALAAIEALGDNEETDEVFVEGTISTLDSYASYNNSIQYRISADGSTTNQLYVHNGKGLDGADFSKLSDLELEDIVIVYGKLKKYVENNITKFEVNSPNYIYSLNRRASAGLAWSAAMAAVGITGDKNYATLTNPNGVAVTYSSSDPAVATISDAGVISLVAAGTTTISASFVANQTYKSATVSYELEVRDILVYASISYELDGANEDIEDVEVATNLPNPLPTVTKDGHHFGGWFTDATFETPAVAGAPLLENTTLYVKWIEIPTFNNSGYEWQLVTSADQLVAGKYYVLASTAQGKVASNISSNIMGTEVAAFEDDVIAYNGFGDSQIADASGAIVFLLGGETGAWTLDEAVNQRGLLGYYGDKKVQWGGTKTTWTIAIANNKATIVPVDASTYHILYNVDNPRFTVYNSNPSASMLLPQLYVWAPKIYKVIYNANGGTNAPAATKAVDGVATVTSATPTAPADKVFYCWNANEDGTGAIYWAGDKVSASDADVTIYAIWRSLPTTEAIATVGGKFIINNLGDTAVFSRGNLQHQLSTNTWRCAPNQYDWAGEAANEQMGNPKYEGWVDLFSWSIGAENNYGATSAYNTALYENKDFVDWGNLFPGSEEEWSTLSIDEWYYILYTRANANNLWGMAMIGDNLGMILLPEGWTAPSGVTFVAGTMPTTDMWYDDDCLDPTQTNKDHWRLNPENLPANKFTLSEWAKLEAAGAVFMPYAGRRSGGYGNHTNRDNQTVDYEYNYTYYENYYGAYWTSKVAKAEEGKAYWLPMICGGCDANHENWGRGSHGWWENGRYGHSVRLAHIIPRKYTVTYDANGGTGDVPTDENTYLDGAKVTVAGKGNLAKEGYAFAGWKFKGTTYKAGDTYTIENVRYNENIVFVAQWSAPSDYVLVTKHTQLADGDQIIIAAAGDYDYAMGEQNGDIRSRVEIAKTEDKKRICLLAEDPVVFTLGVSGDYFTFNDGTGYLCATTGSNKIGTQTDLNDNGKWAISVSTDANGVVKASVVAQGSLTNKTLQYNSGSPRFSCYSAASLQAVALYKIPGDVVVPSGNIGIDDIAQNSTVTLDNGTMTVNESKELDDLTLGLHAVVDVEEGKTLETKDLTIKSTAGESTQMTGVVANVTYSNFYLEIRFYNSAATLDAAAANQWYMISAPFDVALNGGFFQTDGTPMVFGQDFDLFEYDGEKRANTGVSGWARPQGVMHGGHAALIGFNAGQSTTIRLKAATTQLSNPTSITLNEYTGESAANSNWNGVANPTMYHINFSTDVQTYDNDARGYQTYSYDENSFVVGRAFFVHGTGTVDLSAATHPVYAPRREAAEKKYSYCVRLASENSNWANQMYVRASEEASASYEAGHDLETMNGTSGINALLWTNNYSMRLAIEEAPLINDQASYELGLYAPKNGEYRIEVASPKEDADLYLTREGAIIWNLSESAYTFDLNKGVNTGYGLLLKAKMPQTPTGIENGGMLNGANGVQKVIIDEHVYILRGGQMYDVNGKLVK